MNDALLESWIECKKTFLDIAKNIEPVAKEPFKNKINYPLSNAGKLFFKTLGKIDFSFPIPNDYKIPPTYSNKSNQQQIECYREYWLCVLGLFARKVPAFYGYEILSRIKLPFDKRSVDWSYVDSEYELAQPYIITRRNRLNEVCNCTIGLCELLIQCRQEQGLRINLETQTICYKNKTFRIGGTEDWSRFTLLYEAQGETVSSAVIKGVNKQTANELIGELKRHLNSDSVGADFIADAIKNQPSVGYYLDFSCF